MVSSIDEAIARQTHTPISWMLSKQAFWVFLAALIACVTLTLVTDTFATPQNLFNVTRNFAFVAIIALGMTVVIISGGIDLSVGSILCLSAMVLAIIMNAGYPLWAGASAALAVSLLIGGINGVLIAYLRIPPFVVTLGMLSVARSAAMVLSNNKMIYQFGPDEKQLFWLGGGSTFGIANPVIALVILAVVTALLLKWTRWGCHVFAIGSNEKAAVLTGIAVRRLKVSVYMFSALFAGIAGVLEAGWLGGVTTNLGQSMELSVIAAAVIGGANLMGGAGTVFGSVVGAALIEIIRNSLTLLGISTFWQGTFVGSFIVLAVAFDRIRARREADN
ncbi:ABC transporter permease [Allomesorhizobium camelthorni]|uniref:ABC transporter permease n=1 Tax=Allomesorhizobium camelthorni TaxID=475069 RepID=A0A6G4W566_9HYPH|nr:ABC transporter permease [Mesorhizobium camelthorni]NGO49739.1 ABC transporter permease [Mesorhizobium camelthorni]